MQLGSDRGTRVLVGRHRAIIARRADDQAHFSRPRPAAPLRPGAESAIQITGEHRNIPAGDERTDATFEFLKLAGGRAGSFRKNDQNVAGIRKKLTANRQTLADMCLSREGQCVYDHRRDPGARHALEKIIRRRRRKRSMQPAQRQSREQANRIEMTGMIGDEHKRTIAAQMFLSDDFETAIGAQQSRE